METPQLPKPVHADLDEQYRRVTEMIHCYAESAGLSRDKVYNPERKNWLWKRGSAGIEVLIETLNFQDGSRRDFLRIFSPLMDIPANNLLGFYRHLLELNDQKLGVKLSIMPNTQKVYATDDRDIKGMDYYELSMFISDLEIWADKLDDELKAQFPNWSN
ncbi:hypothetical protein GCM10028807_01360 [Spirosoma daeguense]